MLDLGWAELLVIVLVAFIVAGPKELPRIIRSVTDIMSYLRGLARDFQSGIAEMAREVDLEEAHKELSSLNTMTPTEALTQVFDEDGRLSQQIKDISKDISHHQDFATLQSELDGQSQWQDDDHDVATDPTKSNMMLGINKTEV